MNVAGAELFAPLGNLDKLFFMDSAGHMLIAAEADTETEVRPNSLPGGYQQVLQEAEAVLQRAAVLIGTLVGARRKELMDQIAMRAVELDGIKAADSGSATAVGEGRFHVMDFFQGQHFGRSGGAQRLLPWSRSRGA